MLIIKVYKSDIIINMRELIPVDPTLIRKKCIRLLTESGLRPGNCPKEDCLHLSEIKIRPHHQETQITLRADPPQLPPQSEILTYSLHQVCEHYCPLQGNPNKGFVVTEDVKGIRTEARWL